MWTEIFDDERRNGWANIAGSTADIVIPIRQGVVDRLLGRVRWPRVVEQLYVRLADDNRLELMVVASLFGFRKRFEAGLRLDPVFDRASNARVALTFENPGLLTTALAMAGSALTLPRGVRVESGRVLFDPDELADAAGYGDVARHLTRADFAIRDGVLWINAALAVTAGTDHQAPSPPASRPVPEPGRVPLDSNDLLRSLAGARGTFALHLTDVLVNRLIAAGLDVWRSRDAGARWPQGLDVHVGQLAVQFESGWLLVKAAGELRTEDASD